MWKGWISTDAGFASYWRKVQKNPLELWEWFFVSKFKKKKSTYTRWWLRNQKGKPSLAVLWCNSPEWFSQSSETFLMLYSTWDVRCPSRRVCCCGECLPELKLLWWYDHLPADTLDSLSPLRPSGNQRCRVLCPFKQSMTSASTLDSPCLPRRLSLSALQQPIIGFFQRSDKCHWLDWRTTSDWFELSSWGGANGGRECASCLRSFSAGSWWMITYLAWDLLWRGPPPALLPPIKKQWVRLKDDK